MFITASPLKADNGWQRYTDINSRSNNSLNMGALLPSSAPFATPPIPADIVDYDQPFVLYNDGINDQLGPRYQMWFRCSDAATVISSYICYGESTDGGSTWHLPASMSAAKPVLYPGATGTWDSVRLGFPSVVYSPQDPNPNTIYKMWYQGQASNSNITIGYATSPDGIVWTKASVNPVISAGAAGTWDSKHAQAPSVVYDPTQSPAYQMWYTGVNTATSPADVLLRTGRATSADGLNWIKDSTFALDAGVAGAWDSKRTIFARVLKLNGLYQLWYSGSSPGTTVQYNYQIGSAFSINGRNWFKHVISQNIGNSDVSDPVFSYTGTAGTFDNSSVFAGFPILNSQLSGGLSNSYVMFYSGTSGAAGSAPLAIGMARNMAPPSLTSWSLSSANITPGDSLNLNLTVSDSDTSNNLNQLYAQWFIDHDPQGSTHDLLGSAYADISGNIALSTTISNFSVGQHTLTAVVIDNGGLAISQQMTLDVKNVTQVGLTSSLNPASAGQELTLTAKVTLNDGITAPSGNPTVADTVTFSEMLADGSAPLTACGNNGTVPVALDNGEWKAICALSNLSVGSHNLTAYYSGDSINADTTSSVLSQQIDQITTLITLTSTPSSSSVYGQNVILAATITLADGITMPSGDPTQDTVTFKADGASIAACGNSGVVTLDANWQATCTISTLNVNVSVYSLTADFSGDVDNAPSSSTDNGVLPLTFTVGKANTQISIVSPNQPNTSLVAGQPINIVVNVAAQYSGMPTTANNPGYGTVSAIDINNMHPTVSCNYTLTDINNGIGSCLLTVTKAGTWNLQVSYPGDGNFNSSVLSATQQITVNAGRVATLTILSGDPQQSNPLTQSFDNALSLQLMDSYNNPVPNIPVTFTAYSDLRTAASAELSLTQNTLLGQGSSQVIQISDVNGIASIWARPTSPLGSYSVVVFLCNRSAVAGEDIFCGDFDYPAVIFHLSNVAFGSNTGEGERQPFNCHVSGCMRR